MKKIFKFALVIAFSYLLVLVTVPNSGFAEEKQEVATVSKLDPTTEEQLQDFENNKVIIRDNDDTSLNPLTRATTGKRTVMYKRGGTFAWSKDYINFTFNGSKVTSSSGWQEVGWVFPNLVKAKGMKVYYKSASVHEWKGKKTISIGSVSPWGDVSLFSKDVTDYYAVYKDGKDKWN
ncbi:hypothetical protein [Gottfriedia acidiceleris]|uniref:hypothetical protein n=1 Tax=Gottfriedia acidiceleris TaxID=371036 RepID=UPI000B43CA3F|nr:hypothetical protein [Gottfriedia acidiceleris]